LKGTPGAQRRRTKEENDKSTGEIFQTPDKSNAVKDSRPFSHGSTRKVSRVGLLQQNRDFLPRRGDLQDHSNKNGGGGLK